MSHRSRPQNGYRSIGIALTVFCTLFGRLGVGIAPTPVHAQVAPSCTAAYTVVAGDDLYQISLRNNTTIAALQAANNITNVNLIFVNQQLCIPGAVTVTSPLFPTTVPALLPGFVPQTSATVEGDIGSEPPDDAIGNLLEVCGDCSTSDINATQRQFRQDTLVCASVKPVPGGSLLAWYRVNLDWCSWYPNS